MGLSNGQIIWRHMPAELDDAGDHVPAVPDERRDPVPDRRSTSSASGVPGMPSLGDLLRQGKENLDAWWISVPTFIVLVLTLLLLTFIGDALRDAFDTRKS